MIRRPARHIALASCTALVLPLAACGSEEGTSDRAMRERDLRSDVSFNGCSEVECSGEIDGAAYDIRLPESWNGTLLIYSHGYRQAEPAPPDFAPVDTSAPAAPGEAVAAELLSEGYALAGSAYGSNGWAVRDGVEAGEALYDFFVKNVGQPDRTYLWGHSLGGLVTQLLAENNPDWVAGAAPMCGLVAGTNANLDLALDVAYAVKTLIYPDLKLSGFASHDEATDSWEAARDAIVAAGSDLESGVPAILLTSALVDAPVRTRTYDGSTPESQVRARVEAILTALGYGTFGRYEMEQRVGGNPSGNTGADYAARVSEEERSLIEAVSAGATDRLLARLAEAERVTPEANARSAAEALGTPTGSVKDPVLTVHTTADPVVLAQNESVLSDRVNEQGDSARLAQAFIAPPESYSEQVGAPYGAGHCNFTPEQHVATVQVLDHWARLGQYPTQVTFEKALGEAYAVAYDPGPWPAPFDAAP